MPKATTMMPEKKSAVLIANIYAYLVLAIGVSVLAVGTYQLVRNLTGRMLLEKYPIGYEESRCDMFGQPYYPVPAMETYPSSGDSQALNDQDEAQKKYEEQNKKAKAECMVQLDELRVRKASTDFYEAVALVFVGLLLTIPHAVFAFKLRR